MPPPMPPTYSMPPMSGNQMPPMGDNQMPPSEYDEDPNQFDTNFDAGVEANEETDPKKYIQQLTGKLSQTLRKYNSELPQPDVDLNKYVAGMINKQATEGLSQQDVDEILSKIESDGGDEMTDNGFQEPTPQTNESRKIDSHKIEEIVNDLLNDREDESPIKPLECDTSFSTKPYTAPDFK